MKPGRELDAVIAEKIMGQTPEWREKWKHSCLCGRCETCSTCSWPLPYSSDIAMAMEVLMKVCKNHQLSWSLQQDESDGRLYVAIKGQGVAEYFESKCHGATMRDIPFHICLAALKATGCP